MDQKVALITGAARGIGLATAKLFLDDGWLVAMLDRDAPELTKAQAALGQGTTAFEFDVSDPAQAQKSIDDVLAHFGRIDALVNNAGVADFGPIEETGFDRWRTVMATNLDGVFLMSQAATPALKQTKGALVNIASISGARHPPKKVNPSRTN